MCGVQILDTTYYKQTGGGDQNKAAKLKEANEALQLQLREGAEADTRDESGATAPALDRLAPRAAPSAARLAPGAHVTAALASAAPPGAAGLHFQASGVWAGSRPGFFFSAGAQGLGYYPDGEQVRMASARDASAGLAAGHPAAPSILSAGATAAALATAGVAPRHDPDSMAAAAAAKAQLVGGTLTSSMGAAGRPVQKGGAGGPPSGWAYDAGSGMYFDTASQQYWAPDRGLFFDCAAQTWSAKPKGGAAVTAVGVEGRGKTRVPDKWGL
jgi:hypothetical protein